MATIVDSLLVTLGLNGSDLEQGLSGVEQRIAEWVKDIVANVLDPLAGSFASGTLISDVTDAVSALGKVWENAVRVVGDEIPALRTVLGLDEGTTGLLGAGSDAVDGSQYEGNGPEAAGYSPLLSGKGAAGFTPANIRTPAGADTEKLGAAATAPQVSLTSLSALVAGGVSPVLTLFDQTVVGLVPILENGMSALSDLWSVSGTSGETSNAPVEAGTTAASGIFSSMGDFFTGILDSIPDDIINTIKTIASAMSDVLLPDGLKAETAETESEDASAPSLQEASAANGPLFSEGGFWADIKESISNIGESIKAFDNQMRSWIGGFVAQNLSAGASLGLSPALAAGAVYNNTGTTVNVGGIVVNAHSNDAVGIARETGNEVQSLIATINDGVQQ